MSPVVDATTQESRPAAIAAAAEAVRAGELVVLPTDTVYGVGCDAFSADAVARVLEAKGRGREMPPPVLIHDVRTLDGLAIDVPPYVRDLVERYWPGPLTVIVQAQPSLHWDLGDTFGTVALRVPDDPIARELLKEIGPMAVTSANRTGQPPATTVLDAATQLGAAVSVYVDGGPRGAAVPSTILDCTGPAPVVLRAGAISEDDLLALVPAPLDPHPTVEGGPVDVEEEPRPPVASEPEPVASASEPEPVASDAEPEASDAEPVAAPAEPDPAEEPAAHPVAGTPVGQAGPAA